MTDFVDSTHNLRHDLGPPQWIEDLNKSGQSDLTGYQEGGGADLRHTLSTWCQGHDRGLYYPEGTANPISWKTSMFGLVQIAGKPFRGVKNVHPNAKSMGVDITANPGRDFVYVGLRHRPTGKKVLRINVHPTASATKAATDPLGRKASQWKNWSIQQYWLDIISFTAHEMSRGVKNTSQTRFWDLILMGGDYNADLFRQKSDQWYYPSQMLPALWAQDGYVAGLDHLQHVHGSDVKATHRWAVDGHTDHRIHFVTLQFTPVDDTPGA